MSLFVLVHRKLVTGSTVHIVFQKSVKFKYLMILKIARFYACASPHDIIDEICCIAPVSMCVFVSEWVCECVWDSPGSIQGLLPAQEPLLVRLGESYLMLGIEPSLEACKVPYPRTINYALRPKYFVLNPCHFHIVVFFSLVAAAISASFSVLSSIFLLLRACFPHSSLDGLGFMK